MGKACLNVIFVKIEVIFKILLKTLKMYNVMNNYNKCSPFLSVTLIFCECPTTELLKLPQIFTKQWDPGLHYLSLSLYRAIS